MVRLPYKIITFFSDLIFKETCQPHENSFRKLRFKKDPILRRKYFCGSLAGFLLTISVMMGPGTLTMKKSLFLKNSFYLTQLFFEVSIIIYWIIQLVNYGFNILKF
jgi:hypothetical protein